MAGLESDSIILGLCCLVIFGLIFLWKANEDLGKQEVKKIKTQNELEEEAFQEKLKELNPDKVIGNKDKWIAFKDDNIVIDKDKNISLKRAAYDFNDQGIVLMLDAPYDIGEVKFFSEKENQEIIAYLEEHRVRKAITWFKIKDSVDLMGDYNFRFDYEYAYRVDEKEKSFVISGSKNNNLKWKLTNIEFSPHYLTDYKVDSVSKEEGYVSGRAGAAVAGSLLGGTTGAVIGSSLGRKTNSTITLHSSNTANEREIPATALLTIKDMNGREIKLSEKYYESDVVILKKYFLVEDIEKSENTLVEEINKLKKLLDDKVITQEEFELGKKKLLS